MARKASPFPVPRLGTRGDSYRIRWVRAGKRYDLVLGSMAKEKAMTLCALAAVALAGRDEWNEDLAQYPIVGQYLRDTAAQATGVEATPKAADELVDAYYRHHTAKNTSHWPVNARSHLQRFFAFIGSPDNITPAKVCEFFDALADMPNRKYKDEKRKLSNATRNRARNALRGFFGWMRKMRYRPGTWNPLDGVGLLREEAPADGIVVWEGDEIDFLLKAADMLRDGVAVWVAVHAGLRRSEIARLRWQDVTETCLVIYKSKTGTPRQVPISSVLAERLAREPRVGPRVVPWPEKFHGWAAAARDILAIHLPKKMRSITDEEKGDEKRKKRLDELRSLPEKHPEKFGWNPFRHTFASRHAQVGRPIDLIAAWLGDSPTVCRRHYARFVPKNFRDTRIDEADQIHAPKPKKQVASKTMKTAIPKREKTKT